MSALPDQEPRTPRDAAELWRAGREDEARRILRDELGWDDTRIEHFAIISGLEPWPENGRVLV